MEAAVEHIQSDIREIKGDIRRLLYGLIGGVLLLAGAGAAATVNLNDKLYGMNEKLTVIIQKLPPSKP